MMSICQNPMMMPLCTAFFMIPLQLTMAIPPKPRSPIALLSSLSGHRDNKKDLENLKLLLSRSRSLQESAEVGKGLFPEAISSREGKDIGLILLLMSSWCWPRSSSAAATLEGATSRNHSHHQQLWQIMSEQNTRSLLLPLCGYWSPSFPQGRYKTTDHNFTACDAR